MPEQRRIYRVESNDPGEINRTLERIAERLDQLEGFRGVGNFVTSAKTPVADESDDVLRYSQLGISSSDVSDNTQLGSENIEWGTRNLNVAALSLENPVWDDLQGASTTFRLPTSNPPSNTAWVGNTYALELPAAADRYTYFISQVTHKYVEDTPIDIHVHFGHKTAGSGYITFEVEYVWSSINDLYPTSSTTVTANHDMTNVQPYTHSVKEIGQFQTGADPKKLSSIILGRFGRLGSSDTFGQSIWLFSVDFHYQIDALGSGLEHTK